MREEEVHIGNFGISLFAFIFMFQVVIGAFDDSDRVQGSRRS
jgi:hypothetical protein